LLAAYRESTALDVCESKRSWTKLLTEDAILLPEIVDRILWEVPLGVDRWPVVSLAVDGRLASTPT
jgi:hypothetical protein